VLVERYRLAGWLVGYGMVWYGTEIDRWVGLRLERQCNARER
jgi:hypothetical protein